MTFDRLRIESEPEHEAYMGQMTARELESQDTRRINSLATKSIDVDLQSPDKNEPKIQF